MKSSTALESLNAKGYARVSRAFRIVSRLDRPDWKESMAIQHSPWSLEEGMAWVRCLGDQGAADHYRRCYSGDQIEDIPKNIFFQLPTSAEGPTEFRE